MSPLVSPQIWFRRHSLPVLVRHFRRWSTRLLKPEPIPPAASPHPPAITTAIAPPVAAQAPSGPVSIALALQGGGAHGAFTWGVLDRLLEEPDLRITAVSGTSAGAMNAVLLAHGLTKGGPAEAKRVLEDFWRKIAAAGRLTPFRRSWLDRLDGGWSLDRSPWLALMDIARQFVSPYQSNPLDLNPLRDILESMVDFAALRRQQEIALHIAATNVQNGTAVIFSTPDLDARHVMASACLPLLFQAVEIDGIAYWDGGYLCNPPLLPLLQPGPASHLVVVPINPHCRPGTPRTSREILNRLNEITFNASLSSGLESLGRINALLDRGELADGPYRRLGLHIIAAEPEFQRLDASSKINTEWDFLVHLRAIGRQAAAEWLAQTPLTPVDAGLHSPGGLNEARTGWAG